MKTKTVGVVVGRFQAPALHEGHTLVIEAALARHKDVLIVLGSPRTLPTKKNPMDFVSRRAMILAKYPSVKVAELSDFRLDKVWSEALDRLIEKEFPGVEAILYGSRGSFIPYYSGRNKCVDLKYVNGDVSATNIREELVGNPPDSKDFRSGVIYAMSGRPPLSYQTVDVAILRENGKKVLLAGKANEEGKLRFIGGFVDATDESLEFTVKREVFEETSGTEIGNIRYVSSARIDDWRYRGTEDGIMTAFFKADYVFGAPRPADDIATLGWFETSKIMDKLVPEHKPLGEKLLASLKD